MSDMPCIIEELRAIMFRNPSAVLGIRDRAIAEITRLRMCEDALRRIAANHAKEGHYCGVCGAEGGRWPCATYLDATDGLNAKGDA